MVFTNVYNPRSAVSAKRYRSTLVSQRATLGADCTVVCGVTIGRYAFVGQEPCEQVSRLRIDGWSASPTNWLDERIWEQLDLPLSGHEEAQCPHTQQRYRLNERKLVQIQT